MSHELPRSLPWRWRAIAAFASLLAAASLTMSAAPNKTESTPTGWFQLAPLPDPIGLGGMAAGVIEGRLVAVGGSQWDKPIWAKGARLLSDRIFVLDAPDGKWRVDDVHLPVKAGHFATATTKDAIYFAGGLGESGVLRSVYKLEAKAGRFACTTLPELPEPIIYGAAAISAGRLYVLGGLPDPASKVASSTVWSLGLAGDTAWRREPDLPQGGRFVAAAAGVDDAVYFFGGMGFDVMGKPAPSAAAYRLQGGTWTRLPEIPAARVGAASPCAVLPGNRILLAGGYGEIFGGAHREHPGFPPETFIYDRKTKSWLTGPALLSATVGDRDLSGDRGPFPMIGAPAVEWNGLVVIISGEVRVSTRSPAVVALRLDAIP